MAFTVREFRDFVRILEKRPEWKEELRRLILTHELLELPGLVRELVEAQKRTEEELGTLTTRVDSLALQLESLTAKVDSLVEAQRSTEEELGTLTARVDSLTDDVGMLKGDALERRYRERAPAYFGRLLRRVRVVSLEELRDMVDRGLDEGTLTEEEADDVMECDLVVRGLSRKDEGKEEYLLVEVSWGIGVTDVERALGRAEVLRKLGLDVVPVVAGKEITSEARGLVVERGVGVVIDGKVWFSP